MSAMINILHIEDDAADAEAIRKTFAKAHISCRVTRVHTRKALDTALRKEKFDIILAEYRLARYSGLQALQRVRDAGIDVPFLFVSDVSGEDALVEGMRHGASDYVLKKRLARLAPAVRAALKGSTKRHSSRTAQLDDALVSFALNNVHESAFLVDDASRIRFVNDEACRSLGYARGVLLKMTVPDIDIDFSVEKWKRYWHDLKTHRSLTFESRQRRNDGSVFPVEVNVSFLEYGGKQYNLALARDISKRKQTEEALWQSSQMLKLVLDNMPAFVFWKDLHSVYLGCNYRFAENAGLPSDKQIIGLTDFDLPWKDVEAESYRLDDRTVMESGIPKLNYEETQFTAEGRLTAVRTSKIPLRNPEGRVIGVLGTFEDITERKRGEHARLEHLRFFEAMDRINRAIQSNTDLERMMSDVLELVLEVFDCDRAYLLHPCDPDAPVWSSPMEKTKPEYPGIQATEGEAPMTPELAETFRIVLASDGPVKFGPGTPYPLHSDLSRRTGIKSIMTMALHPRVGKPWQFGIHQCSHARVWTAEDERLHREIGRRLEDGLTSLLVYRDLAEAEAKYRGLVEESLVGVYVIQDRRLVFVNACAAQIFGYTTEEMVGRPVEDVIAPEDRTLVLENIRKRVEGEVQRVQYVFRGLRKDGQRIDVEVLGARSVYRGRPAVQGTLLNITERNRAEQAQRRLNRELRAVTECNQALMHAVDEQSLLNEICRIVCDEAGYSAAWVGFADPQCPDHVKPIAWDEAKHPGGRENSGIFADPGNPDSPAGAAFKTGVSVCIQDLASNEQSTTWNAGAAKRGYLSCVALPLLDEAANAFGVLMIFSSEANAFTQDENRLLEELAGDLAFGIRTMRMGVERKRAESELRKLSHVVEQSPVSVVVTRKDGAIEYVNPKFSQLTGYTFDEVRGKNPRIMKSGETDPQVYKELWATITSGGEWHGELHNRKKNGELFWEAASISPVRSGQGEITHFVAVKEDITERKMADLAIRASLKEKETLLKEIHHRVKNNLQVISSLLSLQANETADPHVKTAFAESQDRIRSMALVHEQLYRSQLLSEIDFQQYINVVTARLIEQHARRHITSSVQVDNVWLDIGRAIPCGLIVNELVSNCLKHAFIDREEGHIAIRMQAEGERMITLEVIDDGCGFPEGVDFLAVNSMGLTIVRTLVDQLDGTIRKVEGKGTHFVIEFSALRR